jgi:hypothetical protein
VPPEPPADFDPHAILATLERHLVRFVLVGGFAAQINGANVVTRDIDITPAPDQENMERLAAALAELGAGIRVDGELPVPIPTDGRLLASGQIWNLTTRHGDLDITAQPAGTGGYDDLRRGASRLRIEADLAIDVASLADVIRSKEAANRPKDHATLPELRRVLEQDDLEAVRASRHDRVDPA